MSHKQGKQQPSRKGTSRLKREELAIERGTLIPTLPYDHEPKKHKKNKTRNRC